jgi:hypothetical protein
MPGTRQERARIIANARQTRQEIEEIFVDCDHWNTHVRKPNEMPIDCDPDGELRRLADGLDTFIAIETGRGGAFQVDASGRLVTTPDDDASPKQ